MTTTRRLGRAGERVALLPTTSADDVADFLVRMGVTGQLQEPCYCPIAEWIGDPDRRIAVMGQRACELYGPPGYEDEHYIDLPESVSMFIARFDKYDYPELVK